MKTCNKCKRTLDLTEFYFKRTANCYSSKCKECLKAIQRRYNKTHKEAISKSKAKYLKENKEQIKERKKFHTINKEQRLEYSREWYKHNKLSFSLRERTRKALITWKASPRIQGILGCTPKQFRQHIERQFKPGMTWDNYGEWELDPYFPISKANLDVLSVLLSVFNYRNVRPVWALENKSKGSKIIT